MLKPSGLLTGFPNNISDLAWHIAQIGTFAFGNNFPPQDPTFSGIPLSYPFLTNLFSAIFIKAGAPLVPFLIVQSFLFICITVAGLAFYASAITRNSGATPWLAILLLMFNGGLGFVHLIVGHELDMPHLFNALFPPPYDLTGAIPGQDFQWMNFFSALIVPQRTLLFGLPIAIFILCLWWWGIQLNRNEEFIWAGMLAGGLPLFHGHMYLAIMIYSLALAVFFRTKKWLYFFIPAVFLALPQGAYFIFSSEHLTESIKWKFGWMAKDENMLAFWARNLGVFLPVYVLSLWKAPLPKKSRLFSASALSLFLVGNLIRFAPWDWDNIKVFFLWYAASVPVVAQFFSRLLKSKKWFSLPAGLLLLLLTTLSGALTVYRLTMPELDLHVIYTKEEITLAESLRELTPPESIFLSAPEPNQIAFLAGRKSAMGYSGWMWSHGIDDAWRNAQIRKIYTDPKNAVESLRELGVDYVLVGPREKNMFHIQTWEAPENFLRLIKTRNYEIFRRRG